MSALITEEQIRLSPRPAVTFIDCPICLRKKGQRCVMKRINGLHWSRQKAYFQWLRKQQGMVK